MVRAFYVLCRVCSVGAELEVELGPGDEEFIIIVPDVGRKDVDSWAAGRGERPDISLGSCVQIALFVAPVLVLVAPAMGQPQFQLVFSQAEMWMLFGAVLLGATVATTGQSNWFKGVQLLALDVIIAAVLYLIPAAAP